MIMKQESFYCAGCGRRIIPSDDDAGVCIECGGRNRLEDFTDANRLLWVEGALIIFVAFFFVYLLVSKNVQAEEETIYQTFPGTTIPNPNAPSYSVDRNGTIYQNIPRTQIPDRSKPRGKIRNDWDLEKETRIEPLRLED